MTAPHQRFALGVPTKGKGRETATKEGEATIQEGEHRENNLARLSRHLTFTFFPANRLLGPLVLVVSLAFAQVRGK